MFEPIADINELTNDATDLDEDLLEVEMPTELQGGSLARLLCKLANLIPG